MTVRNSLFAPAALTVPAGTTVTWTWDTCSSGGDAHGTEQTCVSHNVTFDQGPGSATQTSGTFERTFPSAGTYACHCTIHGTSMSGRVVAQ